MIFHIRILNGSDSLNKNFKKSKSWKVESWPEFYFHELLYSKHYNSYWDKNIFSKSWKTRIERSKKYVFSF